ncbi:hypothetical protein N7486_004020 [Penicillium sp. IBT 16267x]|nr:hypothetical protein N7486_004020 [Penicillium sp. IBT 16267x]
MPVALASTSACCAPSFELKAYHEDEGHLAQGKSEPSIRSQTFILHLSDQKWWIKVTFTGDFAYTIRKVTTIRSRRKRERREEYQDFIKLIDYRSLPLLKDTVTEVLLENEAKFFSNTLDLQRGAEDVTRSEFISQLNLSIREDPSRVVYPPVSQFPTFPTIETSELAIEEEITDGVFRVFHKARELRYILKVVNRPLYQPRDTEVMERELENLEEFKGAPGLVQAAGLAVSTSPYLTSKSCTQQWVISGVLLEYYSGGSLQHILDGQRMESYPWERWPIQIGTALHHFHMANKTYMDIKPSNVVINGDGDAILIDVSGIGGITHEWRAPEIRNEISPLDLSLQVRRLNDTWAYGKLLLLLASRAGDGIFVSTLKDIANHLTEEDVQIRWTICDAIRRLQSIQLADR